MTKSPNIFTSFLLLVIFALSQMSPLRLSAADFNDFLHTHTTDLSIGAVYVDEQGVAWLGTSDGLMTYSHLMADAGFRKSIPKELREPIHLLYGLNDGSLAVITITRRIYLFDPKTYKTIKIDDKWLDAHGIDNAHAWGAFICSTPDEDAILTYGSRVYRYNPSVDKTVDFIADLGEEIKSVWMDYRKYYVFTDDKIVIYDFLNNITEEMHLPANIFTGKAMEDTAGNLWVGDNNLYLYDKTSKSWRALAEDIIVSALECIGNHVFVSTNEGILLYDTSGNLTTKFVSDPMDINSIVSDHVCNLYTDKSQNLWIMYSKGDMSILSPYNSFMKPRHISSIKRAGKDDDIITILPDHSQRLWMGTDGDGLYLVDKEGKSYDVLSHNLGLRDTDKAITEIFYDSKGRLWIGSYRSGLICYSLKGYKRFLDDMSPFSIVEDIDGNIFVGTSGNGIYRIDANLENEPLKIKDLPSEWIQQMQCNRTNTILVAGSSDLMTINTKTLQATPLLDTQNLQDNNKLKNFETIYRDSRGLIWVSGKVGENRLEIIDKANDRIFTIDGLSEIGFNGIAEDDNKNIWLSSGSDIYNVAVLYDSANKSYTFSPHVYHLKTNERNTNYYNYRASAKLDDGSIVFGGKNGCQIISPSQYTDIGLQFKPKGALMSLKVNDNYIIPGEKYDGRIILNESLNMTDKITLNHDQKNITLIFSPQDYASPFTDKFKHQPDIAPSEVTITSVDEKFLSEAIKIVEENMSNPEFSVEMLSEGLNMHRSNLYKKISVITGKTPIEFIRLIRLKRAQQYLEKSQMYISEIAYKVGFNNPRLFSRYFKDEFNMTPREYMKSIGKDPDLSNL